MIAMAINYMRGTEYSWCNLIKQGQGRSGHRGISVLSIAYWASRGSLHSLGRWSLGPQHVDANLQFSSSQQLKARSRNESHVVITVQNAPIINIW